MRLELQQQAEQAEQAGFATMAEIMPGAPITDTDLPERPKVAEVAEGADDEMERRCDQLRAALEEADIRAEKAEARAEAAEKERDNCSKTAIELLGSSFCDAHGEKVKQLNFSAFSEWIKEMGCLPCAIARLATALAKNERAEQSAESEGKE